MRTLALLFILVCFLGVKNIRADIEGAPYHYPTSITLKDSTVLKGYIIWSPDWDWNPTELDTNFQFCNSCHNLFYKFVPSPDSILVLYKSLIKTNDNFPFNGWAVTPSSVDTIEIKNIHKVEIKSHEEKYYSGGVFIINEDLVDLIRSAPFNFCKTEDYENMESTWFINYNNTINKNELTQLSNKLSPSELIERKIIAIKFYYAAM